MSRIQNLANTLDGLRAGARLVGDLPKMLPRARTSPSTLLEGHATRLPGGVAVMFQNERYTWSQLNGWANRYANWFSEQGLAQGDVVALVLDNRPEFLFALHGLNKLGCIASLINHNLTGAALIHALRVCNAKKVLCGAEHLDKVDAVFADVDTLDADDLWVVSDREVDIAAGRSTIDSEVASVSSAQIDRGIDPQRGDTFCYIYTSGTTGLPKAAIISHQRVLTAAISFGRLMVRGGPGDIIYVTLPLYHSSAMFLGWGSALATGAGIALRRKFSASNFWNDVRGYGATSFIYIGELCRYLLNTPVREGERDHHLRVAVGNGMRPDIWEDFQERFAVPLIREFYGATEGTGAIVNTSGRPGMIGRMMPGQVIVRCDLETGDIERNAAGFCESVGVGEVGLLLCRISRLTSFDGYVDREASQKKVLEGVLKAGDQFFNTGDLIQMHEGRWLSFADRVGDTFRWKGENVSTNEVAEILNGASGMLEANVYGVKVPNADGRAGMAALSVDDDFELEGFAAFVGESLPVYQRPLFLRILGNEMRVTGTFKHQKVDYRREGFDPSVTDDPLFLLRDGHYAPLDAELFALIEKGEVTPG